MERPISVIEYKVLKSSIKDDDIQFHIHIIDRWPYICLSGKMVRTYSAAIKRIDSLRSLVAPRDTSLDER